MNYFDYYLPTRIVFGAGTEKQVGTLVKECNGSRVFVIYGGGSAKRSGLLDRIGTTLAESGIPYLMSGGVVPNPVLSTARKMVQEALEFQADFILAVGGGSVIDTAKMVAHGVANPDIDIWKFITKEEKVTKSIPVGVVLTIAAAGSETSDSAVLTNDTLPVPDKRGLNTNFNRPVFAVLNPELTMTLPLWQIGAGAADIFMHTDERYFTTNLGNHLTDEIAEGVMRDIVKYGPMAIRYPNSYEAMSEVMWCGSVSHNGLTGLGAKGDTARDGDWAVHQLGIALSALYDSTHGATLTAVWGAWANYVKDANPARFAQLARNVYGVSESDDQKAADLAIAKTNEFFAKLGMPLSIHELLGKELNDDELKELAYECSYHSTRKIGTFKVLDENDMYEIYKAAR